MGTFDTGIFSKIDRNSLGDLTPLKSEKIEEKKIFFRLQMMFKRFLNGSGRQIFFQIFSSFLDGFYKGENQLLATFALGKFSKIDRYLLGDLTTLKS